MMVYSSGTTGKPKGVRGPRPTGAYDGPGGMAASHIEDAGLMQDTVYLSPAPLYHAAPLGYTTTLHRIGATVVVLRHFDAQLFLETIERYKVTVTQAVPTMFVRLLKLPDEIRLRYDLSSLKKVIHAAAPCPPSIKFQMIEWLEPDHRRILPPAAARGMAEPRYAPRNG